MFLFFGVFYSMNTVSEVFAFYVLTGSQKIPLTLTGNSNFCLKSGVVMTYGRDSHARIKSSSHRSKQFSSKTIKYIGLMIDFNKDRKTRVLQIIDGSAVNWSEMKFN
jgi:hypothetical protein